jgi:hypothetical protein
VTEDKKIRSENMGDFSRESRFRVGYNCRINRSPFTDSESEAGVLLPISGRSAQGKLVFRIYDASRVIFASNWGRSVAENANVTLAFVDDVLLIDEMTSW